jgi:hypothetical protein
MPPNPPDPALLLEPEDPFEAPAPDFDALHAGTAAATNIDRDAASSPWTWKQSLASAAQVADESQRRWRLMAWAQSPLSAFPLAIRPKKTLGTGCAPPWSKGKINFFNMKLDFFH